MTGPYQIKATRTLSVQDSAIEPLVEIGQAVLLSIGSLSSNCMTAGLAAAHLSTVAAQDAKEGMRCIEALPPDLILLDILLPDAEGCEFCRSLATNSKTRDIPVILISAEANAKNKLDALASGCVDYLVIPAQADEIVARINIQLRLAATKKQLQQQNEQLRKDQETLERQVTLRTAAQSRNNQQLRLEIGERVRIETALRSSEEQFRTLAENASDIIIRYDRQCRRLYVNPAYEKLSNRHRAGVLGKTPMEASMLGSHAADYQVVLEKVIATGINAEAQFEWISGEGQRGFYQTRVVAEHDRQGRVMSVLAVSRNISALKEAARHLEESRVQLRELTTHREAEREEEHKQIARELHDELGQLLTTLRMRTRLLQPEFIGDNQQLLQERTTSMLAIIDEAVEVVRDVVSNLRPGVLDLEISSALQWLGHELSCNHGIICDVDVPDDKFPLDDHYSIALFRITQESLTNTIKHSGATRVNIKIRKHSGQVVLEIRDNGKGFDSALPARKKTYGLLGIKERVEMLDGHVSIESTVGCGVTIRVQIPVDMPALVKSTFAETR